MLGFVFKGISLSEFSFGLQFGKKISVLLWYVPPLVIGYLGKYFVRVVLKSRAAPGGHSQILERYTDILSDITSNLPNSVTSKEGVAPRVTIKISQSHAIVFPMPLD